MVDTNSLRFEMRRSSLPFLLLVLAVVLLLLFMVWPLKYILVLTLWAAYVLWWPTVWLEKYIHRRGLAALIIVIVVFIVIALSFVSLTVIVARQLAELVAASANSGEAISSGLNTTVKVIPGLSNAGPVVALISALRDGGGSIVTTFVQTANGVVRTILINIPILVFHIILVFVLLIGLLARGDVIVNDFKGIAPPKYRGIVNRFLDHLNPIYYSFFVIYFAIAVIVGILAAIIWGLLGVPFFLTFAVFIVFVGLIPSIGRALIYIPLALWLFVQGQTVTALVVLIVAIVVFELIMRYTIQPRWMERSGKVPRALTFIAFTFALVAFGVVGFAIGPALIGFALAMWRTYKDIQKEQEEQAPAVAQASGS